MEAHMREFGVEPMCRALQIAPSTWYEHARRCQSALNWGSDAMLVHP